MKNVLAKVFLLIVCCPVHAQFFPVKDYPKKYFRDPLNIPISLAANFGELRSNHYHMGLDIRTQGKENLPVYASADGYIARIKIEPFGFGQAIYINHPNGYTTVYAHLNSFFPALADYIKQQQYKIETWKISLDLPPGMFPVKKGDFIAFSGNTGGSEGPHLHFEIRRTADDVNVNPMLFGLPISDNVPPVIQRLAMYDLGKSIYEQRPQILPVKKKGKLFSIVLPVLFNASKIGFAISAFDAQSGSANPNGVFEAIVYDHEKPVTGFQMDNISYGSTRNINAHIDYKTKANGGPYLQQLFELPGYRQSIYKMSTGGGAVDISDGAVHALRIDVKDAYGNISSVHFNVQRRQNKIDNIIYPGKLFYPFMLDGYETDDCAFYIGERSLYDSVHIQYARSPLFPEVVSGVHRIGAPYIPIQDSFLVRIKSNISLTPTKKEKVLMQRFVGSKTELQKVQWKDDWASASFRDFGNFQLVIDEEPPVIIPVGFTDRADLSKSSRIEFIVKDNLGEYNNFRAELDGKWLRFTNDKERVFIYKFDEKCPAGQHQLKITVEDKAGNTTSQVFRFRR